MSLTYVVGNPGSGKTYFAVHQIWKYFYNKKTKPDKFDKENLKKYQYCYTNINEFKFDLFENVYELKLDEFNAHLKILFEMYKNKLPDKELINYCVNAKLNNSLIVLDEVHNLLLPDEVTIWWLTYHRHLYQDLIFITQDLSLVPTPLKRIAEFVYKAVDITKRFFKNSLRYVLFSSYKMTLNSVVKGSGLSLKINDEVANLYQSGDANKSKPIIGKFLVLVLLLISLSAFLFYFFINQFFSPTEEKSDDKNIKYSYKNSEAINQNSLELANSIYYEIYCFKGFCEIKNGEYYQFPSLYLDKVLEQPNLVVFKTHFVDFLKSDRFYLFLKNPVFENLRKVDKNVNSSSNRSDSGGLLF